MRQYFRSLARPARFAQTLQAFFPALGQARAQQWAATVFGYGDWEHLRQAVGSGEGVETKELTGKEIFSTPKDDPRFSLAKYQGEVLGRLIMSASPDVVRLEELLTELIPPLSRLILSISLCEGQVRKLGLVGRSDNPYYRGLAFDLIPADGELGSNGCGKMDSVSFDRDEGGEEMFIHRGIPSNTPEAQFYKQLLGFYRNRLPYSGYTDIARKELGSSRNFGHTSLTVEAGSEPGSEEKLATQLRYDRYFLIHGDAPEGHAVLSTRVVASSFAEIPLTVEVTVEDAWTPHKAGSLDAILRAFAASISTDVACVVHRLLWFRVGAAWIAPVDAFLLRETDTPVARGICEQLNKGILTDTVDLDGPIANFSVTLCDGSS